MTLAFEDGTSSARDFFVSGCRARPSSVGTRFRNQRERGTRRWLRAVVSRQLDLVVERAMYSDAGGARGRLEPMPSELRFRRPAGVEAGRCQP